jgi:thioredoxin 1
MSLYKKYGDLATMEDYKKDRQQRPSSNQQPNQQPNQQSNQQQQNSFKVLEVQGAEHLHTIFSRNRLVVVDVWAEWCGPCRIIAPRFAELAQQYNDPGNVYLVKQDMEHLTPEQKKIVTAVPTFLFYFNGRLVNQSVGVNDRGLRDIEDKIRQLKQG